MVRWENCSSDGRQWAPDRANGAVTAQLGVTYILKASLPFQCNPVIICGDVMACGVGAKGPEPSICDQAQGTLTAKMTSMHMYIKKSKFYIRFFQCSGIVCKKYAEDSGFKIGFHLFWTHMKPVCTLIYAYVRICTCTYWYSRSVQCLVCAGTYRYIRNVRVCMVVCVQYCRLRTSTYGTY